MSKKATLATIKIFIRKNREALLVRTASKFEGMTDCVENTQNPAFIKALPGTHTNNLDVAGAWFVFDSCDYITPLNEPGLIGYNVYNCCGSFDIAIKAQGV
jgi:hypothetical protein